MELPLLRLTSQDQEPLVKLAAPLIPHQVSTSLHLQAEVAKILELAEPTNLHLTPASTAVEAEVELETFPQAEDTEPAE